MTMSLLIKLFNVYHTLEKIQTFMIEQTYFVTNVVFIVISAVMGICFLAFPKPMKKEMRNYRISLRALSGAYFVMASLTILLLIFRLNDNSKEALTFYNLLLSTLQALLFAFTLITLLNPRFVNRKQLFLHSLPLVVLTILYFLFLFVFGDPEIRTIEEFSENMLHPTLIVRFLFFLFYVFQLVFYTVIFLREEKKYERELEDYYADVIQLKLSWVRYAFFSALVIGTLSVISNFFPFALFDIGFTMLFSLFYLGFAIEYIKYNNIYIEIVPAINAAIEPVIENPVVAVQPRRTWTFYRNMIIIEKYYLKEGINIEEMAIWLKIGRTTLSNFINNEEKMNFNLWINTLRIEEAKRILVDKPELTILNISHLIGYSEQANFSRQFKNITGESPMVWRQRNLSDVLG
jgi:AraC-like DNA-binding protein